MTRRQSAAAWTGSLVISAVIFLQMCLYAVTVLSGWRMDYNLVEICHSWLRTVGLTSLGYILDGLVVFTLLSLTWEITEQVIQSARMKRRLLSYKHDKLTAEISLQHGTHEETLLVLAHPNPMAITMGFLSPKIVVTSGLLNLLTAEELEAVIAHERYHRENRDPFKLFILSLGASILWYIPIQHWFLKKFRILQELLADRAAVTKQGTAAHLGSALLKMMKSGTPGKMPFSYASFADTSVNYRIRYLLDPAQGVALKIPRKTVFLSGVTFSLICGLFIYALV